MTDSTPTLAWEATPGLRSWLVTAKDILTAPRATLRAAPTHGIGQPFLFWLPGCLLGLSASMVWPLLFRGLQWWFDPVDAEYEAIRLGLGAVVKLAIALVGLPAAAAAAHGLLVLFAQPQRPRRGYEATFRTVAYSSGSAAILLIVPCTGEALALVWGTAVAIAGLAAIHELGHGVATVALLIPLLLGCGLLVGVSVVGTVLGIPL